MMLVGIEIIISQAMKVLNLSIEISLLWGNLLLFSQINKTLTIRVT